MKLKNKTNTIIAVTYWYSQCSPSSIYFSFNCKYTHWKMLDPSHMTGFSVYSKLLTCHYY